MTPLLIAYMCCWIVACAIAAVLLVRNSSEIEFLYPKYRTLLFQPWKVATFLIATTGMAIIAPYSGDPTWDYVDTTFMCVLTYLTAPWAVGTLYLKVRRKASWTKAYIAICVWMFSASWSYDLYMLLRDGSYPMTWLPNIFASSVLYVCAGLLWSLEWQKGRGVMFGFMQSGWPEQVFVSRPDKVMWYALSIITFVVALTIPFFV